MPEFHLMYIVIVGQGSEIWAGSGIGETKTGTEKENNSKIRPEVSWPKLFVARGDIVQNELEFEVKFVPVNRWESKNLLIFIFLCIFLKVKTNTRDAA